jgi:hypothetical protein
MEKKYIAAGIIVLSCVFGVCGCANQQRAEQSASNSTSGQRTYSSQDLNRTGQRTVGEQLQAADPAVTAQGGGR